MKNPLRFTSLALALVAASHAAPTVYEGFNYADGTNTAANSGLAQTSGSSVSGTVIGLTGSHVMNRGNAAGNVNGTAFGSPGLGYGSLTVEGGRLNWDGVNTSGAASNFLQAELTAGAKTDLAPAASAKTIWMSALIKPNGGFSGSLGAYLGNNAGSGDNTGANVAGLGFNTTGNAAIFYNNTAAAASVGTFSASGTYWLVGNFTYSIASGTTTFSAANVWIFDATTGTPPASEGALGAAAATFTGTSTSAGNRAPTYLRIQSGSSSNDPQFDEVRVGLGYTDIAPGGTVDTTPPQWASGFPNYSLAYTAGFTLNAKIDEGGTVYYVVLPDGATAPSSAQVAAGQDGSGNPVSLSGSAVVSANTTQNFPISSLTAGTAYDVYLVAKDANDNLQTTPALVNAATDAATGRLIIDEHFNYALDATDPDPDGGLNGGNGLPATNSGGVPTGTSTGMRTTWGANTKVTGGLSYTGLLTSNNALTHTATGFQDGPRVYWSMTTDPFLAYRTGSPNTFLGADNTTLYFSYLFKVGDSSTRSRLALGTSNNNVFVGLNGTNNLFTVQDGTTGTNFSSSGSPAITSGDTYLVVGKMEFHPTGTNDTMSIWINPDLTSFDGSQTPELTVSRNQIDFNQFKFNSDTANNFTIDELRVGTALNAVTPPGAPPANNYGTWADSNGVTGGVNGDSDNDGVTNGMEYALQTNLAGSNGSLGSYTGGTVSFTKRAEAVTNGDVTYIIETSSTLATGSWTAQVIHTPPNATNPITYALPTGQGKIFARLRVEIAP